MFLFHEHRHEAALWIPYGHESRARLASSLISAPAYSAHKRGEVIEQTLLWEERLSKKKKV